MLKKFNIRIYGLLIENGKVLLADEVVKGRKVTKFPGGGLELGEGPKECLVREFKEETGIAVQVKEHFYTTDFFQQSAFREEEQIISIYFIVKNQADQPAEGFDIPFDTHSESEEILGFRWISMTELKVEDVTLPIDKIVVRLLTT